MSPRFVVAFRKAKEDLGKINMSGLVDDTVLCWSGRIVTVHTKPIQVKGYRWMIDKLKAIGWVHYSTENTPEGQVKVFKKDFQVVEAVRI